MVVSQAGVDAMTGYGLDPSLQVDTIFQGGELTRLSAFYAGFGTKMSLEQIIADMSGSGYGVRCSNYFVA